MIQRETALQDEHDSYSTKIVCYSHNQITYWNESNFSADSWTVMSFIASQLEAGSRRTRH